MTSRTAGFGTLLTAVLGVYFGFMAYVIAQSDSAIEADRPLVLGLRVLAGACAIAAFCFGVALLDARSTRGAAD